MPDSDCAISQVLRLLRTGFGRLGQVMSWLMRVLLLTIGLAVLCARFLPFVCAL